MERKRTKTWEEKVQIVKGSFTRAIKAPTFASDFYRNLFFLKPRIKDYFTKTDFEHQDKALMRGLEFLMGFLDQSDQNARVQVLRLSQTHSHKNLNVHPHDYYYWLEALVMTVELHDSIWSKNHEYYWREVISYPVTFMISQYFSPAQA